MLRRAAELPPRTVLQKARARVLAEAEAVFERLKDGLLGSYIQQDPKGTFNALFGPAAFSVPATMRSILEGLATHYRAHRFDLLGSGWVRVVQPGPEFDREGGWLAGRIPTVNLKTACQVWRLLDEGYEPIDWQVDFKSGFRWSAMQHSSTIATWGNPPGVDIKVPWELARCQHLPQLALLHLATQDQSLAREFRNQVLDFVAQNPPRFGVNWVCTMDVAIRITNWLVARDLFTGPGGFAFDAQFEDVMLRSANEHALHIATHLEWSEAVRGNHYLADVCGLLFAAAALPSSAETDLWLAFSIQELISEARTQFHEEGSNFEASTAYHRLSAELVVYSAAVVLGLPAERVQRLASVSAGPVGRGPAYRGLDDLLGPEGLKLPGWFAERIQGMGEFVADVSRADGSVIQVGDNDSGRFFKLPGSYKLVTAGAMRQRYQQLDGWDELPDPTVCPDEDVLDHSGLTDAIKGLLQGAGGFPGSLLAALARARSLPAKPRQREAESLRLGGDEDLARARVELEALPQSHRQAYRFSIQHSVRPIRTFGYRAFGLYGWRGPGWSAWMRCGPVGQGGIGGHAHNDALGLELEVGGVSAASDPGTCVYTPDPAMRNCYRSAGAHFVPRIAGREPASLDKGLFVLPDTPGLACLYFGERGFAGEHLAYGAKVMRVVLIADGAIVVEDGSWGEPLERCRLPCPVPISPKYGALLR